MKTHKDIAEGFRELPAVNYNLYLGAGTNEFCLKVKEAEEQILSYFQTAYTPLIEEARREERKRVIEDLKIIREPVTETLWYITDDNLEAITNPKSQ